MSTILNEIEAAHWARFARFKDFQRAIRDGNFPKADRNLPDGPRWDRDKLTEWMRNSKAAVSINIDEQDLRERAQRLAAGAR